MAVAAVPDDVVAAYTSAGWWGTRTVGDLVRDHARRQPDATAIVAGQRRSSWSAYDTLADRLAAAILGAGARPGDRVGVLLPDGLAVHAALVAAQRAGVVAVGIGARAGIAEVAHLLGRTGSQVLITGEVHRERPLEELVAQLDERGVAPARVISLGVDDEVLLWQHGRTSLSALAVDPLAQPTAARALGPNDLSMLNSTSGTTGLPKCVMQFENRWMHFSDLAIAAGGLGAQDVVMGAVPAPFGFGLWTSHFAPAILGVPTVMLPRFSAEEMVEAIERERVTVLCCVSTQFRMLLNSPLAETADLSSLRVMFTGGETVPFEQARAFEERFGALVLQFFGSNETGAFSYTTRSDPPDVRLKTAGRLIPHMNVRLVDEHGADITHTGGPGRPAGVGPLTCLGYYDDPEANAQLYTSDGAMLMGDLVVLQDGCLSVVGRTSDFVIRGGKNISAAQVEGEVATHPGVDMVVVVPVPDPLFGERVAALVTLRAGAALTLEDLCAHLDRRGVTRECYPEYLVVVDEIPRSSGGKLAKAEARLLVQQRLAGAGR